MPNEPVAIVGMGMAVPGASSPEQFWSILGSGPDLFVEAPPNRWRTRAFAPGRDDVPDKGYQPRAGLITDFQPHPALVAEGQERMADLDANALWLRHSLHQVLDTVVRRPDDRFAFCVGLTVDGSQRLQEHQVVAAVLAEADRAALSAVARADIADALLDRFPLARGELEGCLPQGIAAAACAGILPEGTPVHVVDTACSSSLYALDQGIRELRAGRADVAFCGGAYTSNVAIAVLFAQLGGLTRAGQIRSLDAGADGTLFSDGASLVAVKLLSRARADGDRILGVIAGVGLSSDGKGKSINAPASRGQVAAFHGALRDAGLGSESVDLVVAHATGTRAGDSVELASISEAFGRRSGERVIVAANKNVVGHTGWSAGTVSLIHLLLCFRHSRIPRQHKFVKVPEQAEAAAERIRILPADEDWPAKPGAASRTGVVTSFGFGGTNAALIVCDRADNLPGSGQATKDNVPDSVVVVARSAIEPGPAAGVGLVSPYPTPSRQQLLMPPSLVGNIDRSQLMAVDCVHRLPDIVKRFCAERPPAVGVFAAVFGPTRMLQLASLRAHFDDIADALRTRAPDSPETVAFLNNLRASLDEALPMINTTTQPGGMPNLISARIANYFDFQGPNLALEGGEASLLKAFDAAVAYLELGRLEVALVVGVTGNTLPGWAGSVRPLLTGDGAGAGAGDGQLGEGAFLFAVTLASTARRAGLPILAYVETTGLDTACTAKASA